MVTKRSRSDDRAADGEATPVLKRGVEHNQPSCASPPLSSTVEWSILALPRDMKLVSHKIHGLDRQHRAAMSDLIRWTEVFLRLADAWSIHHAKTTAEAASLGSIAPTLVQQLPASIRESLDVVQKRISELERVAISASVAKRDLAASIRQHVISVASTVTSNDDS